LSNQHDMAISSILSKWKIFITFGLTPLCMATKNKFGYHMPPNSLRNPNVNPKVKHPKEIKNLGMFPSSQHLRGRKLCWSSRMGLRQIHKQEFKMKSTCTTRKKGDWCKSNANGVVNLVRTNLSTSFTWLATFKRKHHSPSYNILCDFLWGLHLNNIFSHDSQVGVPKLRLLLSQNFGRSYLP